MLLSPPLRSSRVHLTPPRLQIFHFCSILILLSALMFESGAKTVRAVGREFPITTINGTAAVEEKVDASHYVLVVFVISIVVVSSLYFFLALGNELRNSFAHFCKVRRTVKKQKKQKRRETLMNGGVDGGEDRNHSASQFPSRDNPLHKQNGPTFRQNERSPSGSVRSDNPLFRDEGSPRQVVGSAKGSAESKTAPNDPTLNQFKASGIRRLAERASNGSFLSS